MQSTPRAPQTSTPQSNFDWATNHHARIPRGISLIMRTSFPRFEASQTPSASGRILHLPTFEYFFSLPPELRNEIYAHVWNLRKTLRVNHNHLVFEIQCSALGLSSTTFDIHRPKSSTWVFASKKIFHEATDQLRRNIVKWCVHDWRNGRFYMERGQGVGALNLSHLRVLDWGRVPAINAIWKSSNGAVVETIDMSRANPFAMGLEDTLDAIKYASGAKHLKELRFTIDISYTSKVEGQHDSLEVIFPYFTNAQMPALEKLSVHVQISHILSKDKQETVDWWKFRTDRVEQALMGLAQRLMQGSVEMQQPGRRLSTLQAGRSIRADYTCVFLEKMDPEIKAPLRKSIFG
ncbi:hypothetical protein EJ04DRAFT_526969 [Polyplosphaeria fusca]|uniref:Uncharacterized protein n=1 Tax=Polyplosphaeria fusca TaxID=682080 RepID=A0A9P4QN07_9PLEO|nr:hypothetical protein EJ04DRAFT_526969 [Polyplosphaeria fusca]